MNVGIDPSKCIITKLKLDKDRKARRRQPAANVCPPTTSNLRERPRSTQELSSVTHYALGSHTSDRAAIVMLDLYVQAEVLNRARLWEAAPV